MIACDSICQGKRIFLFALHCILKNLNLHWKRFIRVAQMRVDRLPFEVHYWQFGHQIYISQIYSSELHSIWLRNMTTLLNRFFYWISHIIKPPRHKRTLHNVTIGNKMLHAKRSYIFISKTNCALVYTDTSSLHCS